MNKVTEEQFNLAVQSVISEVQELFKAKNGTYKSSSDPMMNFTWGGLVRHHDGDMTGRYEALKDYVTKHLALAMNNDINCPKLEESTRDIAVYFIIATAMARLNRENKASKIVEPCPERKSTDTCDKCEHYISTIKHDIFEISTNKGILTMPLRVGECKIYHCHVPEIGKACENFKPKEATTND